MLYHPNHMDSNGKSMVITIQLSARLGTKWDVGSFSPDIEDHRETMVDVVGTISIYIYICMYLYVYMGKQKNRGLASNDEPTGHSGSESACEFGSAVCNEWMIRNSYYRN